MSDEMNGKLKMAITALISVTATAVVAVPTTIVGVRGDVQADLDQTAEQIGERIDDIDAKQDRQYETLLGILRDMQTRLSRMEGRSAERPL